MLHFGVHFDVVYKQDGELDKSSIAWAFWGQIT